LRAHLQLHPIECLSKLISTLELGTYSACLRCASPEEHENVNGADIVQMNKYEYITDERRRIHRYGLGIDESLGKCESAGWHPGANHGAQFDWRAVRDT
jgi:hypothetical protein